MLKQKVKSRPVFFKILFSYFLIMAMPMSLLGIFIFGSFKQFYDEELTAARQTALQQTQTILDNIVLEMHSNAAILLHSGNFQTEHLKKAYGNFYDVTRQLATITYTNTFVDAYWYLNSDLDLLFNPETMFTYEKYVQYGVQSPSLDAANVEKRFLQNRVGYWLPMEKDAISETSFMTYVITDKNGRQAPKNSIIFQISQETIDKLIGLYPAVPYDYAMVCWNGEPIYTSNEDFFAALLPGIQPKMLKENAFSYKKNIDGRTYMAFYTQSESSGLGYVYAVPYDTLTAPIHRTQRSFFIILLIVSLLCSLCILYFMNNIYHPLRQVSRLVNNLLGSNATKNDSEEFTFAFNTLSQIQKEKQENSGRKLILQLLSGEFQSFEDLELAADGTGIELYGDRFTVVLLQLRSDERFLNPEIFRTIENLWSGSMSTTVSVHFLTFPESASMVLVADGDKDAYPEFYQKLFQLKLVTESRLGFSMTIGVGQEQELAGVPDSYFQARKACQYQLFQKDGDLIFFQDIVDAEDWKGLYPTMEIQNLYHSIGQADYDRIALSLQTLLNDILCTKSLIYCNLLVRDIVVTAIKALQEIQCDTKALTKLSAGNISGFNKQDELQHYFGQLQDLIKYALSDYQKQEEEPETDQKHETIQDILSYVNRHFYEETLSVKTVADRFDMSVSNLSHYFKKYTGDTISEYIALLRFERAKELLRTTDMVLSDICIQCGYLHLSTFMRQFKAREGCTPSIYRTKYQNENR